MNVRNLEHDMMYNIKREHSVLPEHSIELPILYKMCTTASDEVLILISAGSG